MSINWRVRLKNKTFWLSLIPAVLLLVQVIAAVFGYTLDLGGTRQQAVSGCKRVICGVIYPRGSNPTQPQKACLTARRL